MVQRGNNSLVSIQGMKHRDQSDVEKVLQVLTEHSMN